MKFIQGLINVLRTIKYLGVLQTIIYYRWRFKKNKIFQIKVKGYANRFSLRGGTSDSWVFDMNIIREEYSFIKTDRDIKTIIDGGANIGTASRYFNKRFPKAQIVSVEPSGSNFDILTSNTAGIDSITCLKGGLWSKNTNLKIIDDLAWKYALRVIEDKESGDIQAYSITGIMEKMNWDFIDILKLDIEGSELELLSNNLSLWSHKVGMLIIELHPDIESKSAGILFSAFAGRDFDLKYRGENLLLIFNDI